MTTEKRGSEKLMDSQDELCQLTEEELSQVSGGYTPLPWPIRNDFPTRWPEFPPGFPLGTPRVDMFEPQIDPGMINDISTGL